MVTNNESMNEEEIRPQQIISRQKQYIDKDIKYLLSRKKDFVSVPCVACGLNSAIPAFTKFNLSYVECSECETIYINPRPTPEILHDFYVNSENYKFWNEYIFPATEESRREKIFKPRVSRLIDICKRYQISMGTILEVGAGYGTFCQEINRVSAFKHVIAVEPTPNLANTCRMRGINVIESPIELVNLDELSIDVVASFEVIEHLFSPLDFLKNCARILRKCGLLVVSCPNIKGFDTMLLREKAISVDHEHLNYFSPSSSEILMKRVGLSVIEVLTPGKLDAELVRKEYLKGSIELTGQPFWDYVLIQEWERLKEPLQEFLANNLLSSHLWIVARKI